MPGFSDLLAQGSPWLYLPVALALGALHALEPGHAKTMMAGFIVATRGTAAQAALLGLSAAVAHSAVVWALALLGLWLRDALILDRALPWLTLAGGAISLLVAAWMWRRAGLGHGHDHHHDHDDHHGHDHHHHAPSSGPASTGQVIAVGLSGGLMPCPAAIPVLILSLQIGAVGLGVATVAAFSLGLALVLVGVGLAAAWGLRAADAQGGRLRRIAELAPRIAPAVVAATGLFLIVKGSLMLLK